jgi:hypothetical protein
MRAHLMGLGQGLVLILSSSGGGGGGTGGDGGVAEIGVEGP